MNLFKHLKTESKAIDREIAKVIPKTLSNSQISKLVGKARFAHDSKSLTESISKPTWNFLNRGGKRWRPALMLAVNQALGGKRSKALPLAPIPELIHTGTLLVDDLEDLSEVRRGKPAIHLLYGEDIAINTGNTLYYLPMIALTRSKTLTGKQKKEAYELYLEEMVRLSFGQGLDIYWHKGKAQNVTEKQYLQMCLFKTGVLARFSAKLGAISAGSNKATIEAMGEFGESLGVGFQIQDDILNLKPASGKWGKDVGEDITEGKRSLLVIYALKKLSKKDGAKLRKILDSHTRRKPKIKEAIALIEKTGAFRYSRKFAQKLIEKSWKKIERKLKNNKGKKTLQVFADFAVQREI